MPRQLWNEGRVVGYSAYEMYVKHALEVDPDHEPASEKQWLASMMAMGSSMLLKINPEPDLTDYKGLHYRDFQLPDNSRLCAANTIIASLFIGEGATNNDAEGWCTKVTDYGPLIKNNSDASPSGTVGPDGTVPPTEITAITDDYTPPRLKEYMKITDGIVIQPGTWVTSPSAPPSKDFTPTLSEHPRLRIAFSERITSTFYILFTGFTNRSVVDGVTGFSSAVNTDAPQDGDFLGPWQFPWSNKIIFSVPASFVNYFMNNNYTRELEKGTDAIHVKSDAIIDFKQNYDSANNNSYYIDKDSNSTIDANVTAINTLGEDAAVVATYMHTDGDIKLPPALYGALVTNTGVVKFIPLDTIAPGSLKLYHEYDTTKSAEESNAYNTAKLLKEKSPNATGFLRDDSAVTSSHVVYQLDTNNQVLPVSDDSVQNLQAIQVYNTPYIWFFRHDTQGNNPTDKDLAKTNSYVMNRGIIGNVSQAFLNEYGISWSEVDSWIASDESPFNKGNVNLYAITDQIDDKNKSDYLYLFVSGDYRKFEYSSYQYYLIPVNKYTGEISTLLMDAGYVRGKDQNGKDIVFDFSDSADEQDKQDKQDGKVKYSRRDIMGSWWNQTIKDNGLVDYINADRDVVLENHPYKKIAIPSFLTSYLCRAAVPKPPSDLYGYDFLQWFKDTPIAGKDGVFTTGYLEKIGVHPSYHQLSIHEFMLALVNHDVSKDYTSQDSIVESTNLNLNFNLQIYSRSDVKQTYDGGYITEIDGTGATLYKFKIPLYAKLKLSARISPASIYTPANIAFEEYIEPSSDTSAVEDKTKLYTSTNYHIWGAVGQSGNHISKAIALTDAFGTPLILSGTANIIDADMINWYDLLQALSSNKSIDIVGKQLKGLKKSLESESAGTYTIVKDINGDVKLTRVQ